MLLWRLFNIYVSRYILILPQSEIIFIEVKIIAIKSHLNPLQGKLAVPLSRAKDFSILFQVVINLTNWSSAFRVNGCEES